MGTELPALNTCSTRSRALLSWEKLNKEKKKGSRCWAGSCYKSGLCCPSVSTKAAWEERPWKAHSSLCSWRLWSTAVCLADATSQLLCTWLFDPILWDLENFWTKLRARDIFSLALVTFSRDIRHLFPRPVGVRVCVAAMCIYSCAGTLCLSLCARAPPPILCGGMVMNSWFPFSTFSQHCLMSRSARTLLTSL